jgi:hypothetical protein
MAAAFMRCIRAEQLGRYITNIDEAIEIAVN